MPPAILPGGSEKILEMAFSLPGLKIRGAFADLNGLRSVSEAGHLF